MTTVETNEELAALAEQTETQAPGATQSCVPSPELVLRTAFEAHYGRLVGLAELVVADHASAEEIVQDAFARTWERWERDGKTEDPGGYLWVTALNLSRGRLRRRRVRERHLPDLAHAMTVAASAVPEPDDPVVRSERRRSLLAAMDALSSRQREVVALRFYLDLTVPEIAAALSLREGTVKSHLHRAMTAMAQQLEDER
jgi:RNA polymerase sigma factor (sigma-70 family)